MTWVGVIGIWLAYHGLNILFAKWNAVTVRHRIDSGKLKQIEHFWYGLLYTALCVPQYWFVNIWFFLSILFLHMSIFSVEYNFFRGLAPFNLSRTSKSIMEKFFVRIGLKSLEVPVFVAEFISVVLFIISLFKL